MHTRTRFVLFALALLISGAWWTLHGDSARGMVRLDLSQLASDRVDKIELSRGETTTIIKKQEGRWQLSDGRWADDEAIRQLLVDVRQINTSEHIGSDATQFEQLGVAGSQAAYLTLGAREKTLAHVVVGIRRAEHGSAAEQHFIRRGNDVFLLDQAPIYSFFRPDEAWEDRRVTTARTEDVVWLESEAVEGQTFVLERQGENFVLASATGTPPNFRYDPLAAKALVESVSVLVASRVHHEPPPAAANLLDGVSGRRLSFKLVDGTTRSLRIGATAAEGTQFVAVDGIKEIFELPPSSLALWRGGLAELDARNVMAAIAPESVSELLIRSPRGVPTRAKRQADGSWQLVGLKGDKALLDTAQVQDRIRQVAGLEARKVLAEPSARPPNTARGGEVVLTHQNGNQAKLSFGATSRRDTKALIDAFGSADKRRYQVSIAQRDAVLAGAESLRERAPGAQSQGLESLPPELRQQIMQQLAQQRRRAGG